MRQSQDLQVCTTAAEALEAFRRLKPVKVRRRRGKRYYVNLTATLDIETTNTEEDGFAYSFAMNIEGINMVVRYIEELEEVIDGLIDSWSLGGSDYLSIYIHNLGYEYQYMAQILHEDWTIKNALYTKARQALYLRFGNGIEFRDSLKLFQKSLAGATKGCPHPKLKGDLDYSVYRTPDTPLTQQEFDYIVNDVQGLYEAIERLKAEHDYNAATIPLTNTSMVIEEVNRHLHTGEVQRAMRALSLGKHELDLAYHCMAGGDTHGTRWRASRTYENCNSYDLKSAHPSEQALWKFPAGEPFLLPEDVEEDELSTLIDEGYGWLGKVYLEGIQVRPECPNPTLSLSKTEAVEGLRGLDNGRVLGADAAFAYLDSNDYKRFREAYTYTDFCGVDILAFKLEYLPDEFREAVFDKFRVKESAEDGPERVFAKVCVNTIFGACAQKTVRDEYDILFEEVMERNKIKWEDKLAAMEDEAVIKTQQKKFSFLWGLWTSSLSRLRLWELQKAVGWERLIYWDTDSVKYEGPKLPAVDHYNQRIIDQCIARDAVVVNRKGKTVYIGVAEDEHPTVDYGYRRFRFLHAKCYAAEAWDGERYTIETTIAGVGKEQGKKALDGNIDTLADGLYIADAGGQALTYVDVPVRSRTDFKRRTRTASYIIMRPREYLVNAERPEAIKDMVAEIIVE